MRGVRAAYCVTRATSREADVERDGVGYRYRCSPLLAFHCSSPPSPPPPPTRTHISCDADVASPVCGASRRSIHALPLMAPHPAGAIPTAHVGTNDFYDTAKALCGAANALRPGGVFSTGACADRGSAANAASVVVHPPGGASAGGVGREERDEAHRWIDQALAHVYPQLDVRDLAFDVQHDESPRRAAAKRRRPVPPGPCHSDAVCRALVVTVRSPAAPDGTQGASASMADVLWPCRYVGGVPYTMAPCGTAGRARDRTSCAWRVARASSAPGNTAPWPMQVPYDGEPRVAPAAAAPLGCAMSPTAVHSTAGGPAASGSDGDSDASGDGTRAGPGNGSPRRHGVGLLPCAACLWAMSSAVVRRLYAPPDAQRTAHAQAAAHPDRGAHTAGVPAHPPQRTHMLADGADACALVVGRCPRYAYIALKGGGPSGTPGSFIAAGKLPLPEAIARAPDASFGTGAPPHDLRFCSSHVRHMFVPAAREPDASRSRDDRSMRRPPRGSSGPHAPAFARCCSTAPPIVLRVHRVVTWDGAPDAVELEDVAVSPLAHGRHPSTGLTVASVSSTCQLIAAAGTPGSSCEWQQPPQRCLSARVAREVVHHATRTMASVSDALPVLPHAGAKRLRHRLRDSPLLTQRGGGLCLQGGERLDVEEDHEHEFKFRVAPPPPHAHARAMGNGSPPVAPALNDESQRCTDTPQQQQPLGAARGQPLRSEGASHDRNALSCCTGGHPSSRAPPLMSTERLRGVVASMANAHGGAILIGVADDGEVVGTDATAVTIRCTAFAPAMIADAVTVSHVPVVHTSERSDCTAHSHSPHGSGVAGCAGHGTMQRTPHGDMLANAATVGPLLSTPRPTTSPAHAPAASLHGAGTPSASHGDTPSTSHTAASQQRHAPSTAAITPLGTWWKPPAPPSRRNTSGNIVPTAGSEQQGTPPSHASPAHHGITMIRVQRGTAPFHRCAAHDNAAPMMRSAASKAPMSATTLARRLAATPQGQYVLHAPPYATLHSNAVEHPNPPPVLRTPQPPRYTNLISARVTSAPTASIQITAIMSKDSPAQHPPLPLSTRVTLTTQTHRHMHNYLTAC